MRMFPTVVATASLVLIGCGPQVNLGTPGPGSAPVPGHSVAAAPTSDVNLQMISPTLATASAAPAGYLATPHGYYHESCVYNVDENDDAGALRDTACPYPRVLIINTNADNPPDATDGWIEDSNFMDTTAATKMTSSFTVPTAPSNQATQLVYFFPGMQPQDGTVILQPVLAWGANPAGGGAYYSIASWSCGPSCVHGNLAEVAPGDRISGTISGASCNASGACSWTITTKDTTSGATSTLKTTGDTESYPWLFGGVLESYGVAACDQFPSAGALKFSGVKFYDQSGALITPAWKDETIDGSLGCTYATTATKETTTLKF
jgi:hypothetical protein